MIVLLAISQDTAIEGDLFCCVEVVTSDHPYSNLSFVSKFDKL